MNYKCLIIVLASLGFLFSPSQGNAFSQDRQLREQWLNTSYPSSPRSIRLTPKSNSVEKPRVRTYGSSNSGRFLKVRTTAYTHTEKDHIKHGRKTAMGTTLRYGERYRSAAADWSRFPVGTAFRIVGQSPIYIVEDYGRALVGTSTIDIYKPTRGAMNHWGVRHVKIEILRWGSFEKSFEILTQRGRMKYAHVRKMAHSIERRPTSRGFFTRRR